MNPFTGFDLELQTQTLTKEQSMTSDCNIYSTESIYGIACLLTYIIAKKYDYVYDFLI